MMTKALLEVADLSADITSADGIRRRALRGVSFSLMRGERLGIVGESGAGKSLLALALLRLLPPAANVCGGAILFDGADVLQLSADKLRKVRGGRMAMIFQDPMTTLNPVLTIGEQLAECARDCSKKQARELALRRLREVAIPSAEARMRAYPHELSGGMRQRVVIAAALISEPDIIIADEPTTALDVTIQAEIMALLARLCQVRKMALILITHDLSLASQMTDRLMVMYAGAAVECGNTADVIGKPLHPYTRGLLSALPENYNDDKEGRKFNQIPGRMPPLADIPAGCAFHPRCAIAAGQCRTKTPPLAEVKPQWFAACPRTDMSSPQKAESSITNTPAR
ncbi:MAG: ABC transporter ATP-binding protein [Gammaproteobacteria bacterium]